MKADLTLKEKYNIIFDCALNEKSRNPLKDNGLRDFSYSFSTLLFATTARLIFEENFENQEC